MTNTGMPWAYRALMRFGCLKKASSGGSPLPPAATGGVRLDAQGSSPNLLLSHPTARVQRVVWLLYCQNSVLGIEVSPRFDMCGCLPMESYTSKNTSVSRVVRHLHSLPFQVAGSAPFCSPMVVHKNHLIGWCLDGTAAPLYTHTLRQLSRLRPRVLKTLSPENAVVCRTYYEWDSWREIAMEPGWSHHTVGEHVTNVLVNGQMTLDELRGLAAEAP